MSKQEKITTPLIEYLESIELPIIDDTQNLTVASQLTVNNDQEAIKERYENFVQKALECLKIAAGYTEDE